VREGIGPGGVCLRKLPVAGGFLLIDVTRINCSIQNCA
jgi:hypothetical protein